MTSDEKLYLPEKPPFGLTVLFGVKGSGKSLGAINSPWEPVHVIDVEGSTVDYHNEMGKLVEMGILSHGFTRADCPTYPEFYAELDRIKKDKLHFGTLVIDTGGQYAEWLRDDIFSKNAKAAEKQSQMVWGMVRNQIRDIILKLESRSKLVIVTAHERDYRGVISPRLNPAVIELASLSIRLVRLPNSKLPDGHVYGARLPYFPPRIQGFTVMGLMKYFDAPADWNNLSESEKRPPEPIVKDTDYIMEE